MVLAGAALVGPAGVGAAPGDGGEVSVAPQLSLTSLGAESTVAFYGAEGVSSLTMPVPRGLIPASLDAVLEIPVNMTAGALTVAQGDRTLARIDLPPVNRAPIAIPLAGAEIVDNAVTVLLRTYLTPIVGFCFEPSNPLRLVDTTIRYDGAELPPTSVADFLPPVLRQLRIFLPAQPTRSETDAAIRLATAVAARYGKQSTGITVQSVAPGDAAPPAPSLPLERHVVIREEPGIGVSLLGTGGVPALLITGPAGELSNQTRLLASDLSRLALSSKAVVGPLRSSPQLPADSTTLRQLGQPGVNATALSPQVSIALDQTRMGRAARDVRVQLLGSYTPLPASVGGQLVVAIGGETLDRWPADSSGSIDRWIDVPDRLLQRYTSLGVAVQISGNTGRCGEFQPVTLTLDGDTKIESKRSTPPLPGGFQTLPQALMPRVEIGIGDGFDDARRATRILVGLQRLSALPIDTSVVTVDQALASPNPAVLVSADGWDVDDMTLPVAGNADGQIAVGAPDGSGEPTTLNLDPTMTFGSLQTLYDGSRTVLVATSNSAPEQLDALLDWLDADTERWSQVKGDALIATPGREPVAFGAGDQPPAQAEPTADRSALLWGAGAAVAVLLAAGAITLALRRKRVHPS